MFFSLPASSLPRAMRGTQCVERPLLRPFPAGSPLPGLGRGRRAASLSARAPPPPPCACPWRWPCARPPAVRAPAADASPRFPRAPREQSAAGPGVGRRGRALRPDPEPPAPRRTAGSTVFPGRPQCLGGRSRGGARPARAPGHGAAAAAIVAPPRPAVTCAPAPRLRGRARPLAGHRRGHPEAAGTEAERRCRPRLRQRQPCAERRPDGGGGGDGRAGERPERRPQPRRRPARGGQAAGQRREGRLLRGAPDVPDPLLQVGAAPRPPPAGAPRPAAEPGAPPPAAPHWPRRAAPRRHWPAPLPVAWAVGAGGGEAAGGGLQPGSGAAAPRPPPRPPPAPGPAHSGARPGAPRPGLELPAPDPRPRPGPRVGPKPWPRVRTARVPEPPRPLAPSPALSAVESESLAARPPALPRRPAARL